jgi:hypothetical protein
MKVVATLGAPFFRSPERGARSLVFEHDRLIGARLLETEAPDTL